MFPLCPLTLCPVIIQRRGQFGNSPTYFQKTWTEYQNGFSSKGELWLGLDQIHDLTKQGQWRLDVVMGDWYGQTYNARYNDFRVGSEATDYTLTIASFDSSASNLGDSMITRSSYTNLNGMKFSTKDRDNDKRTYHCSTEWFGHGGWWLNECGYSNPNGLNLQSASGYSGIVWYFGGSRGKSKNSWKSSQLTITQIG